ncbi:hypothetical protein [Brucella pseudogrignonensis]|uniref:cGAS/DncV-like nucleotidyltransferase C-terminal helical domain-containing protein n=1 Tax=Brucella pseudogrignonensis TaxID=419475 RepID=A0ABU1MEM9_9HYPH|nr:hypothetical protein [Brucella pseudogrignonensis]MDR6434322.1 hypothetical protein [Brucella pseudogrignonensis]
MARDITKRLEQLAKRRKGTDRLGELNYAEQAEVLNKSVLDESWQKRAPDKHNTRYALGAMQAVDPDYTRISLDTAERVGNQLLTRLENQGLFVEFRIQGSVALDVHIRGVSDVDLLTLDRYFYSYNRFGPKGGSYSGLGTTESSQERLMKIRLKSEVALKEAFPAATVDKSGGKAIAVFGGSLARPVDVVPSHWYDTAEYQTSSREADRAVTILDKNVPTTIDNWPFLHIQKIHDRDGSVDGGVKKAIRLAKNVKNDAETEGTKIALPSFDIASIMYHADLQALARGSIYELSVLAEAQRHLNFLSNNQSYAMTLAVPDGSRKIIDKAEKFIALQKLSFEFDDLVREVAIEQVRKLGLMPSLQEQRNILQDSYIL